MSHQSELGSQFRRIGQEFPRHGPTKYLRVKHPPDDDSKFELQGLKDQTM